METKTEEASVIDKVAYPQIGEIRKGREIGYKGLTHNLIWAACEVCGKERWVELRKGKALMHPRCNSCSKKGRIGNTRGKYGCLHPSFKGGRRIRQDGYIYLRLTPDDFFRSMADRQGEVREHRLVVAKALGRCLQPWELVHHKHNRYPAGSNEDKQDNRYPENLQLVTDDRHTQITILENRIKHLEGRVTLLEAENALLKGVTK